jgi:hypothetical protein
MKKLLVVVLFLSVVLLPVVGHASLLWPLHIGDNYIYRYSDSTGAVEFLNLDIVGTTNIDSKIFFTTSNTDTLLGSTENSVYALDEGEYKEWVVNASTPTVSVTVPYGGPFTAYLFTTYYSPSNYIYEYIVPDLGMVKSTEYDIATGGWWEWGELVDRQVVPIPSTIVLFGSGLVSFFLVRSRKFIHLLKSYEA